MNLSWITGRIAVSGGIWNERNMTDVGRAGITHIINMQLEFDDRPLAEPVGLQLLWNPIDDDFLPKPAEVFREGVGFARTALDEDGSKILIHCAAGVHRAPKMALALLCDLVWSLPDAMALIELRRPGVDLLQVHGNSVKKFLDHENPAAPVWAGRASFRLCRA